MKLFLYFAVLTFVGTLAQAFEIQVESNGESAALQDAPTSTAMRVTLRNEHDDSIDFYYVNANDNFEHLMDTLLPGEQYTMNTFTGHSFVVKKGGEAEALSTVGPLFDITLSPILSRVFSLNLIELDFVCPTALYIVYYC
jgi:hypothetical protein